MNRRNLSLLGLAVMLVPVSAFAAGWTALAPLPEARYGAALAVLGGDYHVIGGHDVSDLDLHSVWSPGASAWTSATPLPATLLYPASAALGGGLYALGGFDTFGWPMTSVLRYDPGTGAWNPVAPLPSERAAAGSAVLGGSLYVAGGEGLYGAFLPQALRYDPGSNAWSAVANLPTPRSGPAVAAFSGHLYVMGGINTGPPLATVEIYDPASNAWSPGPRMPEPLWQCAAAAFDGRLWVAGGDDTTFTPTSHVYSLGTDGIWRAESSLPLALQAPSAAADTARLVVVGGLALDGPSAGAFQMLPTPVIVVPPPETLTFTVTFSPSVLNTGSQGRWVGATLEASAWSVADLDPASLRALGAACDTTAPASLTDSNNDGHLELSVKFPREAFASLAGGVTQVCVTGATRGGAPASGCGTINVMGSLASGLHRGHAKPLGATPTATLQTGRGTIRFSLVRPVSFSVDVLDIQGRQIERLVSGFGLGERTLAWPGTRPVANGIYFVRLRTDQGDVVERIAAVK